MLGSYRTVAQNACTVVPHAAQLRRAGAVAARAGPAIPNVDASTQNCVACHNGGSNISPGDPERLRGVRQDLRIRSLRHQYSRCRRSGVAEQQSPCDLRGLPQPARIAAGEFIFSRCRRRFDRRRPGRWASARPMASTVVSPAVNQYENCLRCHGTSTGKQTQAGVWIPAHAGGYGRDPLNVIPQMSAPRDVEPSGDARPQQRACLSPACCAIMLNSGWHHQGTRPWESRILLHRLPQQRRQSRIRRRRAQRSARIEVDAHPGTPLRIQPGAAARDSRSRICSPIPISA